MSVNKVIIADLPEMYKQGLSIPEISRATGIPRSTVRSRLIAQGVKLRSRAEAVRACKTLGDATRGKPRPPFSEEWKANISAGRKRHAEKHACGTSQKPNGYIEHTRGADKGALVHRTVMAEFIGRPLRSSEVVHHIDGDKTNNEINNLALMTRAAHTRLHRFEERLAKGTQDGLS